MQYRYVYLSDTIVLLQVTGTRSEMLVLLVLNVTLNGPLFEDIDRGFKQIHRLYFMWKLQKPVDQPYLEIMIAQTQHVHA